MGNKKNLFTLAYAKKFLNKKGLELFKKSNQTRSSNSFKSLSYTVLSSLILIIIFFLSPLIVNFKNNLIIQSTEVTNSSKNKLENVLSRDWDSLEKIKERKFSPERINLYEEKITDFQSKLGELN